MTNPSLLESYVNTEEAQKILQVVGKKKKKEAIVKKSIILKCQDREDGITAIKRTLELKNNPVWIILWITCG